MSDSPPEPALYGPDSPFRSLPQPTAFVALRMLWLTYMGTGIAIWGLWALLRPGELLPTPTVFPAPLDLLIGIVGGVLVMLITVPFQLLAPRVPLFRETIDWLMRRNAVMFARLPVWCLMSLAMMAGTFEELLFRGWLQPLVGIWWTTLAFALAHFPPTRNRWGHPATWGMVLVYIPTGLIFGGLAEWRGNLFAPMVAHAGADLAGLLLLHAQLKATAQTPEPSPEPVV